jgi:hypothetical protein
MHLKSQQAKSGFKPAEEDGKSASIHDDDIGAEEDDGAEEFFAFQSGSKKKKTVETRPRGESYSIQDS